MINTNLEGTREDENRYILAAAVMRRDWAEVSVLHFMKPDFQHPISQKQHQQSTKIIQY